MIVMKKLLLIVGLIIFLSTTVFANKFKELFQGTYFCEEDERIGFEWIDNSRWYSGMSGARWNTIKYIFKRVEDLECGELFKWEGCFQLYHFGDNGSNNHTGEINIGSHETNVSKVSITSHNFGKFTLGANGNFINSKVKHDINTKSASADGNKLSMHISYGKCSLIN